tara:strand:- start:91 stop:486 length:396 start_codon:yes stop_codon:yes gene_type:complete
MTKRLRKEPSLNPKPTAPVPKSMGGAEMKRRIRRRRNTAMGPKGTKQIEPKIKSEPPTLTKKAGPPKAGHHYGRAGLSTYHKGEQAIANAENKKKRTGHSRSGRMGGGYADIYHHPKLGRRKIGIRKEPKL